MKPVFSLTLALLLASPAFASDAKPSPDVIVRIEAILANMDCQMDPDDIEVEEGGYELDDVMCKGGHQFDIDLDNDLNVLERRAE